MIFNIIAPDHRSNFDKDTLEYRFNSKFLKWVVTEFAKDHLMSCQEVYLNLTEDSVFNRIVWWLRDHKGFDSCQPWEVTSKGMGRKYIGRGFEINDNDRVFIKWKLSQNEEI